MAEALAPEVAVLELALQALNDTTPLLDAAGAVVVLGPEDDAASLGPLAALGLLPAGGNLVLLLDGVAEDLASLALESLTPSQVLSGNASDALLRYAVSRALPSQPPGRGARPNQRPATALLGMSSAIRDVIDQVKQIAPTQIPALILGETGTGKELVARAIHEQSPRADRPFVAVNCGALTDS
ncbi:MAG: sigma 54-interacting transcriptional regulator, partial [Myxococcota bacterium]